MSLISLVIAGEGKDAYGDARATFLSARHSRATFVRGLRVVEDKWWSEGSGYVRRGDGSRTVTAGELLSKMPFMYRSSRDTFIETLAVPTLYQHFARRHFSADEGDRRHLMRM